MTQDRPKESGSLDSMFVQRWPDLLTSGRSRRNRKNAFLASLMEPLIMVVLGTNLIGGHRHRNC